MLHLHPLAASKFVDAPEPIGHPGKQLHPVTAPHQEIPIQPDVLGPAFGDHGVHVRQQPVHAVLPAKVIGLSPEFCRSIAQRRDKGIVLHVRGAQSLIKVIQQRHNRRHTATSLRIGQKRPPGAAFCISYQRLSPLL